MTMFHRGSALSASAVKSIHDVKQQSGGAAKVYWTGAAPLVLSVTEALYAEGGILFYSVQPDVCSLSHTLGTSNRHYLYRTSLMLLVIVSSAHSLGERNRSQMAF